MTAVAPYFRRLVAGVTSSVPVVDSTGLEGFWDFDFPVPSAPPGSTASSAIVEEIDKLGLKFELGHTPQEVMVVESANETPSPNPPDASKSLPPMPEPEFEVAAIKWPCGESRVVTPLHFETGGRVTATCMPLMSLIQRAWGLSGDEKPVGTPKWLGDASGSNKYNITIAAKAPEGITPDPQHNAPAADLLNRMLRKLLIDRYQMKVHYEDRQVDAPMLVAVKPKLTRSEANRTGCDRQAQNQGRSLIVKLACHNMTMTQFAEQIQAHDVDIVYPVVDGTGLKGSWDFNLTFDTLAGLAARFPVVNRAGPNGLAADPTGAVSFADALEKQLGLKLEARKRSVPVLAGVY